MKIYECIEKTNKQKCFYLTKENYKDYLDIILLDYDYEEANLGCAKEKIKVFDDHVEFESGYYCENVSLYFNKWYVEDGYKILGFTEEEFTKDYILCECE